MLGQTDGRTDGRPTDAQTLRAAHVGSADNDLEVAQSVEPEGGHVRDAVVAEVNEDERVESVEADDLCQSILLQVDATQLRH